MFPYGAPHLNAILAIKGAGFRAVIAQSGYSRFIRTCINFGLPYILISDADAIREGDELSIDLSAGIVADRTIGREFKFDPYPSFLIHLLAADGFSSTYLSVLRRGLRLLSHAQWPAASQCTRPVTYEASKIRCTQQLARWRNNCRRLT